MATIKGMKKVSTLEIVDDIVRKRKQRKQDEMVASRQLPLWGEAKRGLPNVFARSALFNARSDSDAKNDARSYTSVALPALEAAFAVT